MRNFQPGEIVYLQGQQPAMVRPLDRRRRDYQRSGCAAQRRAVNLPRRRTRDRNATLEATTEENNPRPKPKRELYACGS